MPEPSTACIWLAWRYTGPNAGSCPVRPLLGATLQYDTANPYISGDSSASWSSWPCCRPMIIHQNVRRPNGIIIVNHRLWVGELVARNSMDLFTDKQQAKGKTTGTYAVIAGRSVPQADCALLGVVRVSRDDTTQNECLAPTRASDVG